MANVLHGDTRELMQVVLLNVEYLLVWFLQPCNFARQQGNAYLRRVLQT